MSVVIKGNAKLNLTLNVTGMYDNTYHSLASVIISVNISDTITVVPRNDKLINVVVNGEVDNLNVAKKVGDAIVAQYGVNGVDILVDKQIDIGGGMGGSSVDAAATIEAMTYLYNLNIDQDMMNIATKYGSDIAYMIKGGLGIATGKGDDIKFVNNNRTFDFVVIKGDKLSTTEVFAEYDKQPDEIKYDNKELLKCLSKGNIHDARKYLGNNLQPSASRLTPYIKYICNICSKNYLPTPIMTGSGGNMFILCKDAKEAKRISDKLGEYEITTTICQSTQTGTELLQKD